jgi:uroporphyrinogen decarboxylase
MAKMTHRERVKAAVDHRTPDRVPLDIGGSNVTTMVDTAYERLKAYLGIEAETVYLSKRARLVVLDDVTAQRLGTDTRPLFLGPPDSRPDVYHSDGSVTDEWQVNWNGNLSRDCQQRLGCGERLC